MEYEEALTLPLVRHLFQFLGAGAFFTGDELTTLIGGVTSITALAWSVCSRKGFKLCSMKK